MPKWYLKIDGVKMGIDAPTREEAISLGVDGLANRDIINNVKANASTLGNPEANPDYAPTLLKAIKGAAKYEAETGSTEAWVHTGFRDRKDLNARIPEHDVILRQRQFKTISDAINEELTPDEMKWKASIRKKYPDAKFTRDAKGNLTAQDKLLAGSTMNNPNAKSIQAPKNANTVNSANTDTRKRELAQYANIDVSKTPFSPEAMNTIRSFVEARMLVGPLPSQMAMQMSTELKSKHPDWNPAELSKALKYYIAHMRKDRASANPYGEGKKLAEQFNKVDLEFDSGDIPGRGAQKVKRALVSGATGTALGVARNFTFGAGEDRAILWLKKQGIDPDMTSAMIGQVAGIALPSKVVGTAAGAVGKALSGSKMANAIRNSAALGNATVGIVRGEETLKGMEAIARTAGLIKNKAAATVVNAYKATKGLGAAANEAIAGIKSLPAQKTVGSLYNVAKGVYQNQAVLGQSTMAGNNLVREILRGYEVAPENRSKWTDLVGSLAQGFEQGDLGKFVAIASEDKDPEIRKLASLEAQKHMDAINAIYLNPEFQQKINQPDLLKKLADPMAVIMMGLNSLGIMQRVVNSQVAGAAWGSGLGTVPARVISGLASGKGSFDIEFGTTFMEEALKAGYNPMEPEAMEKLLQNKGEYAKIREMAQRRGVGVGAFDMIAAMFGGVAEAKLGRALRLNAMSNIAKPNMMKIFLSKALDFTGEQMLGGLGEVAGQKAKANDIMAPVNLSEVQNEMIGDPKGLINIAVGNYADTKDATYAWATTVRDLTTEQQIEQYKSANMAVAMQPDNVEYVAMKKGLKKVLDEKAKSDKSEVTPEQIKQIEDQADADYNLSKQDIETKQSVLLYVDAMAKMNGTPITPEAIDYRNRIINSMTEDERKELGITATGSVEEDSVYEQKLNAVVEQHQKMTNKEASDEFYAEMVSEANNDVEIPANMNTVALIERGQELVALRDASYDEDPQKSAEYEKAIDAINVALIMQGKGRVFQTTASDIVSEHEVARYVSSEMDGKPEGKAKFTIDGIPVDGTVRATDGGVYFHAEDGTIIPIHKEDLSAVTVEPEPEEVISPIEEPQPVAEPVEQKPATKPILGMKEDYKPDRFDGDYTIWKNENTGYEIPVRNTNPKTNPANFTTEYETALAEAERVVTQAEADRIAQESKPTSPLYAPVAQSFHDDIIATVIDEGRVGAYYINAKGNKVFGRIIEREGTTYFEPNYKNQSVIPLNADNANTIYMHDDTTLADYVRTNNKPRPVQVTGETRRKQIPASETPVTQPQEAVAPTPEPSPLAEQPVPTPVTKPTKNEDTGVDNAVSTDGVVRNGSVHMVPIGVLRDERKVDIVRTYTTTVRTQNQMKDLALDIKKNGLQNPISLAIEPDGKITIIEGTHRIYAYSQLKNDFALDGYDNIPVTFVNESVANGSAQKFIDSLPAQKPVPTPTKPVETPAVSEAITAPVVEPKAHVEQKSKRTKKVVTPISPEKLTSLLEMNKTAGGRYTETALAQMTAEEADKAEAMLQSDIDFYNRSASMLESYPDNLAGRKFMSRGDEITIGDKQPDGRYKILQNGYTLGMPWTVNMIAEQEVIAQQEAVNTAPAQETPQVNPFSFAIGTQMNAQVEATDTGVQVTVSDRIDGRKRKTFKFASMEEMASNLPEIIAERQAETATIDVSTVPAELRDAVTAHNAKAQQARQALKEDAKQVKPSDMHPEDVDTLLEQYEATVEPRSWTVPSVEGAVDELSAVRNANVVKLYEKLGSELDAGHAQYLSDLEKLMSSATSKADKLKLAKSIAEYRAKQVTYENAKRAVNAAMHATVINAVDKSGTPATRNGMFSLNDAEAIVKALNDTYGGNRFTAVETALIDVYSVHFDGKSIPAVMFTKGTKTTSYEGADTFYMEFNNGVTDLFNINDENLKEYLANNPVANTTGLPAMSARDIIRTFSHAAHLFVYPDGKLQDTGFLGMAHLMNRTIALQTDSDLNSWLHEFGHQLINDGQLDNFINEFNRLMADTNYAQYAEHDNSTGLDPASYGSMLKFIVAAAGQYADVRSPNPANISEHEGIAEMFRMYTLDPDAMQRKLPRAYAIFNNLLPDDLKKVSGDIKKQIYVLHSLPPSEKSKLDVAQKPDEDSRFVKLSKIFKAAEDVWGSDYKTKPWDRFTFRFIDKWMPSINALRDTLMRSKPNMTREEADKVVEEYNTKISQLLGARGAAQATMADVTGEFGLLEGPGSKQKVSLADVARILQNGSQDQGEYDRNYQSFKQFAFAATHVEDAVHKLQALEDIINEFADAWCQQNNVPFTPYVLSDRNADVLDDKTARGLLGQISSLQDADIGGTSSIIQKALDAQGINTGYKLSYDKMPNAVKKMLTDAMMDIKNWSKQSGGIKSAYRSLDDMNTRPADLKIAMDASARYNELSRAMLYKQHMDGLIDVDTYLRVSTARKYYVDTHRVSEAIYEVGGDYDSTYKSTNATQGADETKLRARKGSDSMYQDPMQWLSRQIEATFVQGAHNQVKEFWAEVFLNDSTYGEDVAQGPSVPIPVQKKLRPSGSLAHEVIGPIAPADMPKDRIIVYAKNGQKKYIQINNDQVYASIQNISETKAIHALNAIVSMQRKMITISPSFVLRNTFRDRFGVWRKSKNLSAVPFSGDWWKLLLGLTNEGKVMHEKNFNELKAAGVNQATFVVKDVQSFDKMQKQIVKDVIADGLTGMSKVWFLFKNDIGAHKNTSKPNTPFRAIGKAISAVTVKPVVNWYGFMERMAERSEMSPRVLEYQKAMEKYKNQEDAWIAQEAKRQGVDMQLATSGAQTPEAIAEKRKLDVINDRGHARTRAFAANDARALQDFGRVGEAMPLMNTLFGPFLSGRMAGLRADIVAGTKYNNKGQVRMTKRTAQSLLLMTILSGAMAELWYMDEERKKKYLGFTDAVKDTFLLVPGLNDVFGNSDMVNNNGVFAVPYGFQDAIIASLGRRLVDIANTPNNPNNPNTKTNDKSDRAKQLVQEWFNRVMTADLPITPANIAGPMGVITGIKSNYDAYTQRNIVPLFETTKMVYRDGVLLRSGATNASTLSFTIANFLKRPDVDPRALDYVGQKLFGTTGRDVQTFSNMWKPANASGQAFSVSLQGVLQTIGNGGDLSADKYLALAGERMKETPVSVATKATGLFSKEQTFFDDIVTRNIEEARSYADISSAETKDIFGALALAANTDSISARRRMIDAARIQSKALALKYRVKPSIPKLR